MRHQGGSPVVDFYDRHPINEAHVMAALSRRGLAPGARLTPEALFEFDQDHYGGPARVLAHRRGCRVVACELNHGRAAGGERLSRLVGVHGRIAMVQADALALPLRSASSTPASVRKASSTSTTRPRCSASAAAYSPMAASTLRSLERYRTLLGRAGFRVVESEDVSIGWRSVLRRRVTKFRATRDDAVATLGQTRYAEYDQLFAFFAGLVEDGKLGGGHFAATR